MAKNEKKGGKKDSKTYVLGRESKGKKRKQERPRSNDQCKSSSLAQLLKKHRGVAASTAPPPIWNGESDGQRNFLTPQDDPQAFGECLKTSFSGFYYDAPGSLPSSLHGEFDLSFGGMDQGGLFLYDTVQPGKKRLTRTSVTRTLVGDPGSTYKYLGLRLFSHPWVDVDEDGNAINKEQTNKIDGSTLRELGYSGKTASALITMGRSNSRLIERSKSMLQKNVSSHISPVGLVGSADFNLTLVNKMESTSTKRDMKKEVAYGMGKISVGWHRDSGLKDFSSIAVYQTLKEQSVLNNNDPWGVALRAMDGGAGGPLGSVPPLLVPLPSGSLYYMLDDFNHNHEHAVIAGSGGIRYSSTHRVAREGQGTWQYIRDKMQHFSSAGADFDLSKGIVIASLSSRKRRDKLVSHVRALQNLMTEIEFEWLRQWFVQGQKHASLHPYWHRPIRILCDSFRELERASSKIICLLKILSKNGSGGSHVSENLFDVVIELLSQRSKFRLPWKERYRDPIFGGLPLEERPFSCPCFNQEHENLDLIVSQLRQWRSAFVAAENSEEGVDTGTSLGAKKSKSKKRKPSKSGSLTKKESKQIASNWEQLKRKI